MLVSIKNNILSLIVFNVIQITDISINRDHHFRYYMFALSGSFAPIYVFMIK